tara:strand:- start:51486 stop:51590 length:105 start_codon:yes stop_codon:yes gene_type:complete
MREKASGMNLREILFILLNKEAEFLKFNSILYIQ